MENLCAITKKVSYDTEREAYDRRKKIKKRVGKTKLHLYKCRFCDTFHLTHQVQKPHKSHTWK